MSRFGQLPEIFEYTDLEFRPFIYDCNKELFTVAGEVFELNSPNTYRRLLSAQDGEPFEIGDITKVSTVLDVFGHPITTPKLFRWLNESNTNHFQETADVMRGVFSKLENIKLDEKHHKEMDQMGFSVGFLRKGHVRLSVLGSCACLGTNPDGHLVDWHDWDTGFTELEFHNIDMPTQYVSLIAGLGHLATLCDVESNS